MLADILNFDAEKGLNHMELLILMSDWVPTLPSRNTPAK
jgi:hypothetical protein